MMTLIKSAKRLQTPFTPRPLVYLSRSWYTTAKGSLAAKLQTPGGLYSLVAFQQRGAWNCAVHGPADFRQYLVACDEPPVSYAQATAALYNFCLDIQEHYQNADYAAAA